MPTGGIRPLCSIANCESPHYAKGYCRRHWVQWRAHGDPLVNKNPQKKPCSVAGCNQLSKAHRLCDMHYQRFAKHGDAELGAFKPKGKCTVPGCDKPHSARGWCAMHYARWQTKGDVTAEREYPRKPMRFILERAVKFNSDDCLIWPFGRTGGGYGYLSTEGKGAHVIVCELVHGPSPDPTFEVAHSCGNRPCCNPRHLRWSSRKENHADKIAHGTAQRGERHPRAKVTEADVREIRSLKGKLTHAQIAKRYGVSSAVVGGILQGRTWKLVK